MPQGTTVPRLTLKPLFVWWAMAATFFLAQINGFSDLPSELHTGNGISLASANQSLYAAVLSPQTRIQLSFGFATDEVFGPDQFFDSFTINLQDTDAKFTAVLAVLDASGLRLAPATPGALPVDPSSFRLESTMVPPLSTTLQKELSFRLDVPVPTEMVGSQINVVFDLFDNLDSVRSVGWFSDVSVVPEPSTWALLVLGIGLFGRTCLSKREKVPRSSLTAAAKPRSI
jgi:hypothetical protein